MMDVFLNQKLPIAKRKEKPFFLMEAEFSSGNIFARINDGFLDKSLVKLPALLGAMRNILLLCLMSKY